MLHSFFGFLGLTDKIIQFPFSKSDIHEKHTNIYIDNRAAHIDITIIITNISMEKKNKIRNIRWDCPYRPALVTHMHMRNILMQVGHFSECDQKGNRIN